MEWMFIICVRWLCTEHGMWCLANTHVELARVHVGPVSLGVLNIANCEHGHVFNFDDVRNSTLLLHFAQTHSTLTEHFSFVQCRCCNHTSGMTHT